MINIMLQTKAGHLLLCRKFLLGRRDIVTERCFELDGILPFFYLGNRLLRVTAGLQLAKQVQKQI